MKNVLITGASSGIGKECYNLLKKEYCVTAPSRKVLDMFDATSIENYNTSTFDIVINCAGVNKGTYLGFTDNPSSNQIEQISVNYIGPLLLAKNYIKSRSQGHFIYVSSISIDTPELYNIVNASSKAALRYAFDEIDNSVENIMFSEICPGKTKTNMLFQNYCGTKTQKEVEEEYSSSSYLHATKVAQIIKLCIVEKIKKIKILP